MKKKKCLKYSIYGLCFLFLMLGCISFKYSDFINFTQNVSDDSKFQAKIVEQRSLTLRSDTVCSSISDKTHCVESLAGTSYISDKSSGKWVILVHGYGSDGSGAYTYLGWLYERLGYNIFTPDLRGHGNSPGQVTFGFLESLDIYDWIKDLNKNFERYGVSVAPSTIVVHGHSMGAATTLQLATNPDIANANGTAPYTMNLTKLKVKGFVDDSGFSSISEGLLVGKGDIYYTNSSKILNNFVDSLVGEYILSEYNLGLTVENYAKYSNPLANGRQFPNGSKVMVIHGTDDDMVLIKNSYRVVQNISPGTLVYFWEISNTGHNPLAVQENIIPYALLVTNFTKCIEDTSCNSISLS